MINEARTKRIWQLTCLLETLVEHQKETLNAFINNPDLQTETDSNNLIQEIKDVGLISDMIVLLGFQNGPYGDSLRIRYLELSEEVMKMVTDSCPAIRSLII